MESHPECIQASLAMLPIRLYPNPNQDNVVTEDDRMNEQYIGINV